MNRRMASRYQQVMHNGSARYRRMMRWAYVHDVSAFEVVMASLILWWSATLLHMHRSGVRTNILYNELTAAMPYWGWVLVGLVIIACLIVGSITQWRVLIYLSLLGKVSWWSATAGILYHATGSLLSTSAFIVLAVGSIIRYAELRGRSR